LRSTRSKGRSEESFGTWLAGQRISEGRFAVMQASRPTTCAAIKTPSSKRVRVALQVGAVLEGAQLVLVDVHGHQARRALVPHDVPFAPRRKTRAGRNLPWSAARARRPPPRSPATRPARSRRGRGKWRHRCCRAVRECLAAQPNATKLIAACARGYWARGMFDASSTASGVANGTGVWCITAAGACSAQPSRAHPAHPARPAVGANSSCAPANSQISPSQTRTTRPGAASSPLTTSKWW
jgi:hypothetical protein